MNIQAQTYLTTEQKQAALEIWNAEYPVRLQMPGMDEFDAFLNPLVDTKYYVLIDAGGIAGWAATFTAEPRYGAFLLC